MREGENDCVFVCVCVCTRSQKRESVRKVRGSEIERRWKAGKEAEKENECAGKIHACGWVEGE